MPAKKKSAKKSVKTKVGICQVCSVGVKPLSAKLVGSGVRAGLHVAADEPVIEPAPEPAMPGPEMGRVQSCQRCDHIPGRISAVLGLLVVVIIVLSMTVLASVMIISSQAFQIQAYNSAGGPIDNIVRK